MWTISDAIGAPYTHAKPTSLPFNSPMKTDSMSPFGAPTSRTLANKPRAISYWV